MPYITPDNSHEMTALRRQVVGRCLMCNREMVGQPRRQFDTATCRSHAHRGWPLWADASEAERRARNPEQFPKIATEPIDTATQP